MTTSTLTRGERAELRGYMQQRAFAAHVSPAMTDRQKLDFGRTFTWKDGAWTQRANTNLIHGAAVTQEQP